MEILKEVLIQKYWYEWLTIYQIADYFQCNYKLILFYLRKYNIKLKNKNSKNLVGQKFGRRTVLEIDLDEPRNGLYWKCQCECNKITTISAYDLLSNKSRQCRECQYSNQIVYYGKMNSKSFSVVLSSAKRRGWDVYVTPEYLGKLFDEQNGRCAISNAVLNFANHSKQKEFWKYNTASLDRKDSSKGYIEGNVQWVHKDVNFMKQEYSQDYFIDFCHKISDFNKR
jgi:hypothetical protein